MRSDTWIVMTTAALLIMVSQVACSADDLVSINETRQVQANERIEIEVMRGEISIRAGTDNIFSATGILDELADGYELRSVNGDLNIESAADEMAITVINGSLQAQLRGTHELRLQSVNGGMDVTMTDSVSPNVNASTVSGGISLRLTPDVDARFSLQSHAGGRLVNNITDDDVVRARLGPARNLEFSTGQGTGTIEMTSVSGRLELHAY